MTKNMVIEDPRELQLDDFGCAAALLASGILLVRVDPPLPFERHCKIVFDDSDGAASTALSDHMRGKLQVSSLVMTNCLQSLKSRIFRSRERS